MTYEEEHNLIQSTVHSPTNFILLFDAIVDLEFRVDNMKMMILREAHTYLQTPGCIDDLRKPTFATMIGEQFGIDPTGTPRTIGVSLIDAIGMYKSNIKCNGEGVSSYTFADGSRMLIHDSHRDMVWGYVLPQCSCGFCSNKLQTNCQRKG